MPVHTTHYSVVERALDTVIIRLVAAVTYVTAAFGKSDPFLLT
jgi:hypothetical protein